MPKAEEVTHKDWTEIIILYDDGQFSAIWGAFRGVERRLGMRWNQTSTSQIGFPNTRGLPIWFTQVPFLEESTLHGLLRQLLALENTSKVNGFIENVIAALREARKQ